MNWETRRRETSLIEHICSHGIGHPNFYSAFRLNDFRVGGNNSWLIHGCDGCCSRGDFPGGQVSDSKLIDDVVKSIDRYKFAEIDKDELFNHFFYAKFNYNCNKIIRGEHGIY